MMETVQALTERRSIRKFADRPVDRETLEQLVQALYYIYHYLLLHSYKLF